MIAVWRKLFVDHPDSVEETYFEHMGAAMYFCGAMLYTGFACFVHAFIPGAFEKTGSRMVTHLHDRMVANRNRKTTRETTTLDAAE
ncbi:MAG: hypothetical protein JKY49_10035 [Cohaesibacteraceae bacterium]|nr:hypothetical protein [Cohaesibacteraceae bacterium]